MANKYAYNEEVDEAKTARAMAKSLKISPKHSVEICSAIRGMEVGKAKAYLEDVIEMKKSVPFKRHNKKSWSQKRTRRMGCW
jgi:large subunit ribosomal protein L22